MQSLTYRIAGFITITLFIIMLPSTAQVVINEYSVSNKNIILDNYSEHEDWIELFNSGSSPVDLGGYYMSDSPDNLLQWQIPAGIVVPSGGYRIIWASGRNEVSDDNVHTNFRLTQTKPDPEWIVLTDPSGIIIDQKQLEITQLNHSRGRTVDGGDTWGIFINPTPGGSNSLSTAYLRYAAKPMMSSPGGFYPGAITVTITTDEPDAQIKYTTNGMEVTALSNIYVDPINVTITKVIKARVFSNNQEILPGLMEFNTYLINVNTTLPVISVAGNDLTELLNGNAGLIPYGSIEFFNKMKVRTTSGYGDFNKHGQDSWIHPQRSIDYVTRDECGYNYALQEKFFSLSDRDEFQRIMMRACGDDNYPGIDTSALIRDDYVQTLSQKAGQHLDWRKSERCIMYVDGVYWGVYSIREKVPDCDYTQFYYDQGKYDIQFIMLWGGTWAEYGGDQALTDWHTLHNFILSNDMSDQANYEYVTSQMDITSLVDYFIINSYVVCSDWLNWNVAWWRGFNAEGSHQKWGWTLWDEDATFGHYVNYTGIPAQSPYLLPCYPEDLTNSWQDPEGHVTMLNKLRENTDFTQYYVSRYIDLLNTAFTDTYTINLLDSMAAIIEPEMEKHCVRWGGSATEWRSNVQKVKDFIITRNSIIKEGLIDCYSLTGPYDIVIDAQPAGVGQVTINSLELRQFPWAGEYFGNIDVKLTAAALSPQYEFDHWSLVNHEVTPSDTLKDVVLSLTAGDTIIALFRPRIISDSLVINEINYHSADDFDPGDWVEFYNPMDYELNITDWYFKDSDDLHTFAFPEGTVIPSKGYLVLCRDTALFHPLFPDVENFIGDMGFGLSSTGELIRLYDPTGILIDTVDYDNVAPWPTAADGTGLTLELINPAYGNALPENWAASDDHGTPGAINGAYVGLPPVTINESVTCHIYPNPFSSRAIFTVKSYSKIEDATLNIYNIFGTLLKRIENIDANQIEINRDGLPSGMYIYTFLNQKKNLQVTGKFIIL
jgi:hypothetical protein